MTLTAVSAKALAIPGLHGDGNGLYLKVTKTGTKSWIMRVTVDGKRRDLGVGAFPGVSLAEARRKAAECKRTIAKGEAPLQAKVEVPTFEDAARIVYAQNSPHRRDKRYGAWIQSLERHAFPVIGNKKLDAIDRHDVLTVLLPLWSIKTATAKRIRQRIRTVLKWGQAHGHIDSNPAGEVIDGALPTVSRSVEHHAALPYHQVPAAMVAIREAPRACTAIKLAVQWLILTGARSGEVRGAKWDEIDEDNQVWTIPGSRMKTGDDHRVPLSNAAMAVVVGARKIADGSGLLFPSPRTGKELADNQPVKLLRAVGVEGTAHGFRSSFRDWAAENTGASWAIMEMSLAHAVGGSVERSYARSDLLAKRRDLMQQWADFVVDVH